ncbi:MAG: hypothetical protein KDD25_03435 [Bdellovibrionales bacterium]|nr:hypothetical protein [Bdellovibrionales bacterium]
MAETKEAKKLTIGRDIFPAPKGSSEYSESIDRQRIDLFLKISGLHTKTPFSSYISDGDVIEIYDMNFVQIYCNGKFFEVTSIPLTKLDSKPYSELYLRQPHIQMTMMSEIKRLLQSEGAPIRFNVPERTLTETEGEERIIQVNFKYAALLFNESNEAAGILVNQTAKHVHRHKLTPVRHPASFIDV